MLDARRRWLTAMMLTAGLSASPALADEAPSDAHSLLQAMHSALLEGQPERTLALSKMSKKLLLAGAEPVPAHVQGAIIMVQGAAAWSLDEQDDAMDTWRAALRVAPELSWDATLPVDAGADTVFEALRREVDGQPKTVVGVPADLGATRLYVAGQPATPDLALPAGSYLVQAACPDGDLRSKWWRSDKPLKPEKLCPGGLGESAVAAEDACSGPTFDDFGNPLDPCAGVALGD